MSSCLRSGYFFASLMACMVVMDGQSDGSMEEDESGGEDGAMHGVECVIAGADYVAWFPRGGVWR